MDNLVFEDSIASEVSQSEFISKKWLYVNDINNGNYSSQIIIDSTPLANAGGYVNWSEGYIAMPLVVSLYSATVTIGTDASIPDCAHSWAFKSGFWHMINSMSVEFNNQNIVQQTPFLNVFRSFKAMTSFSEDDLRQGYSLGFAPDSAGSWDFITADNASGGKGFCNNRNAPFLQSTIPATATQVNINSYAQSTNPSKVGIGSQYAYNAGVAKRGEWYNYNPGAIDGTTGNITKGQQYLMGSSQCGTVFRSYRLPITSDNLASWSVMAKLRLKDLSDYFEKCPLLKGSTMRFLINTNQTSMTFTQVAQAVDGVTSVITPAVFTTAGTTVTCQGLTNPLIVASNDIGQGCARLPAGTYSLSVSIYKDTVNNITAGSSVPVRLYAPVYKMNPIAEQRYLSLAPTKRIEYCDIFQYQFNGIGAGDQFNFLVSNGIPNIQSVLVVPFLSATGNGTTTNTLLSPFSTSGATPDPVPLANFNILISGVNLFLNNQLYDFEQFRQELMSSNQLNGGLTTGLASGLISEDDFSRGMRYYYGNASRSLPSEEGVSRSVQIIGQNLCLKQVNLMVFVEFKKMMTIDISTGARLD
jgi:hypothetical protein